jgi:DNA-binding CsgD family transcriptional regulator
MLAAAIPILEAAASGPDARAQTEAFARAAAPLGVTYVQSRVYRRPAGAFDAEAHWKAGGVLGRVAPGPWEGTAAFHHVCFECNPLVAPVRQRRTRWRFSDYAPREAPPSPDYWDALGEAGIAEGLGVAAHGAAGAIALLHIGVAEAAPDAPTCEILYTAGQIFAEQLLVAHAPPAPPVHLSPREREALRFVADGKTDWEISVILGCSQSTVATHLDRARAKLGAVSRAQAVARLAALGEL